MRVRYLPGGLSPEDYVTEICTRGWEKVTFVSMVNVLMSIMINEELRFPRSQGYEGWQKPLRFLEDVYLLGMPAALAKHRLRDDKMSGWELGCCSEREISEVEVVKDTRPQ